MIAISDVSGGIIREEGLDIDEISEFIANKKLLMDYEAEGVKHISNEELLECDCDVLIPAFKVSKECDCTMRYAAYIVALRKLDYAERIKGIFP